MIRRKLRREGIKQSLAIRAGLIGKRFELPRLGGTQLTTFCVHYNFQRGVIQVKLSNEATTRSEGKQVIVAGRWRKRHHAVESFCVRRRGKSVVFGVGVVAEIDWLAQR